MSIVFASFKHPKLPNSIKILTLQQFVYICMTALSPNLSPLTTSLLTCYLPGCSINKNLPVTRIHLTQDIIWFNLDREILLCKNCTNNRQWCISRNLTSHIYIFSSESFVVFTFQRTPRFTTLKIYYKRRLIGKSKCQEGFFKNSFLPIRFIIATYRQLIYTDC